jgi:Fe-Mn family superoxide dismutase
MARNNKKGSASPLRYKAGALEGLSERQITEHHGTLYTGYVNKTNEIRERLDKVDLGSANGTYGEFRELKVEETFAVNGVRLHEGYFDGMGGKGGAPTGEIERLLKEDFGSWETWRKEVAAAGVSARGWVVTAFDWEDYRIHVYLCDLHNQGGIWNATPLIVLDVYEHAYFLDYGVKRKDYIEVWFKNIDWAWVNDRVKRYAVAEHRAKHKIGPTGG